MSNQTLSDLLATIDFARRMEPAGLGPPDNIQWRADACDAGSILFFQRFDDGRSDAEIIDRYLAGSACTRVVTNRVIAGLERIEGKGIYVTHPEAWPAVVARFCDLVYPLDRGNKVYLGVTGTNGKTTTVKYLEAILSAHARPVLSIGTLGLSLAGEPLVQTGFTSPPLIELRRLLHAHRDRYGVVAMEVSSHALDQGRAYGIPLQNAAWTNFTQDHLDYHGGEAAYFAAKARILEMIAEGGRLYTTRPDLAERLRAQAGPGAPIQVLEPARLGAEALASKPFLALGHNRENYRLAVALADGVLGSDPREDWRALSAVEGRFDCRVVGNRTLVIDFAHTPDALETILGAIRDAFPRARVATLFGCGGDRDRFKRPLMGAAVARWSDHSIVTSDNPRFEDPERIIADILTGMPPTGREVVVERPRAVERLFDFLAEQPDDPPWVALLAGKGHERYLDARGHKTPYSDRDEVERNLIRLGWTRGAAGSDGTVAPASAGLPSAAASG